MNPDFLTPGEKEFFAQEKSITDAVINVIAVAKNETQYVTDESTKQAIVEACKVSVQKTRHFQALTQAARRPYITHAVELLDCLKEVNLAIMGIEDVLSASRSELDPETAETFQNNLRAARVAATETITEFKRWLYTSDVSYMFASDRTLDTPEPASPDVAKTDLLRCPRWLVTHLVQARRAELASERQWLQLAEELNQTKLRLTQATGQEELKQKDATIKKLNAQLQVLYKDMEAKTRELDESKRELRRKSQMLATKPNGAPANLPSPPSNPSLPTFNTTDPEGNSSDAQELKRLRAEVARLKMLLKAKPASTKNVPQPNKSIEESNEYGSGAPSIAPPPRPETRKISIGSPSDSSFVPLSPKTEFFDEEIVPFEEARHWLPPTAKRVAIATLLTDPSMSFVDLLGKTISSGNDADAFAGYLIQLYQSQDTLMEVLEHLIKTEVERCKSVNTLFRGEELSSRVLRSYVRLKGGDYVHHVLNDLITEVSTQNYFFEVDPNRSNPTMNLKENFQKLEELTQRFLDSILNSYDFIPPEFLRLCKCIHSHSAVRFVNEDYEQLVVAGFLFLRFICPAIAAPESFKLHPVQTVEARRTLLLVGKILQNLANGVEFKEDFLQDMIGFLKRNALPLANFFQRVRTYPVEINGSAPYMVDISRSVYTRRDKIKANIDASSLTSTTWSCTITTSLEDRVRLMLKSLQAVPADQLAHRKDVLNAFANMFMDNADLLTQILTILATENNPIEKKQVADDLTTIFYTSNQIPFLAHTVIQNEIASSAYEFLHQSFTKYVFNSFTMKYCADWLSGILGVVISNIVSQNTGIEVVLAKLTEELKPGYNREEHLANLKKLAGVVLESITAALSACPRPLWNFCNTLALNTAQDVCQFFLIHFIVPAIENPQLVGLSVEKPKPAAARTLQQLADVLRNYANSSGVLIDNVPMSTINWSSYNDSFTTWSKNLPGYLSDVSVSVSDEAAKVATTSLANWLGAKMEDSLQTLLVDLNTTHTIRFGVSELMDSLTPPPEKTAVADIKSPPPMVRSSSSNSTDGKDKKKQKEEDKKKKEEEEKKKKEEERKKKEEEKKKKEEEKKKK